MAFLEIPDSPAWLIRAGADTAPAADAFSYINGGDVAVVRVVAERAGGADGNTGRFHALPALDQGQITWAMAQKDFAAPGFSTGTGFQRHDA